MKKYIIIRVILIIFSIFILATLMFFALNYTMFHKFYDMPFADFRQVAFRLYKLFLQERILGWDWGLTFEGEPIIETVVPRFWVSIKYNVIALCVYLPLGIVIGSISAYKQGGLFDRVVNSITTVLGSIPTYLLIVILILFLGLQWHIFPANTYYIQDGFFHRLWGLGIPIIALSATAITKISRVVRSEMIENIDTEYILLARTKGLTKRQTFVRHMLKNNIVPVLPVLVDVFIIVLTGSFFIEIEFGIDGVAELFYNSMVQIVPDIGSNFVKIDVNTMIVITSFYLVVGMVFSLVVDVLHRYVDPRIQMGSKK